MKYYPVHFLFRIVNRHHQSVPVFVKRFERVGVAQQRPKREYLRRHLGVYKITYGSIVTQRPSPVLPEVNELADQLRVLRAQIGRASCKERRQASVRTE